jgi:hypothetical protein
MPTISQEPIDLKFITALVSGLTIYASQQAAITAAVTLSAANSNAPVQILSIDYIVTNGTGQTPYTQSKIDMPSSTPDGFIVQLVSAGTQYPEAGALVSAYALSAANANAPTVVARVWFRLTAP